MCTFIDYRKVFHHLFERLVEGKGRGEDVAGFLAVVHNAGVDGEVGAAGEHIKAFLPVFGAAAGAFGGDDHGHAAVLVSVEQARGAFDDASGVPAVYGQASEPFEQAADGKYKKLFLDEEYGGNALCFERQFPDYEVAPARVGRHNQDITRVGRRETLGVPTQKAQYLLRKVHHYIKV